MKNELTISNTPNSMSRVYTMAAKAKETFDIVEALSATGNKTAIVLINEQKLNQQFQVGYVFGSLKANLDCLPDEIAARQKMNGIPLNLLIKMKVDEFVLDVREVSHAQEMTGYTDYEGKYRRLSECICGFGYNMSFIEERFESFFPMVSTDSFSVSRLAIRRLSMKLQLKLALRQSSLIRKLRTFGEIGSFSSSVMFMSTVWMATTCSCTMVVLTALVIALSRMVTIATM